MNAKTPRRQVKTPREERAKTPLLVLAHFLGVLASWRSLILLLLITPPIALADTIWIVPSAGANALELKNVKITGITEGKVLYQIAGRDTNRDVTLVQRMLIDDEPAFSLAEEAVVANKPDIAVQAYQTALQTTRKPWLKTRISARLAALAPQPARPKTPAPTAVQPQAQATASSAPAQAKLASAAAALQKKDFAGAINEINTNRALFADPQSQSQALFTLADAQAGAAAAKTDTQSWQDAALAYMRVAAHFPDSPLAPRALLQVAQIEQQKLNDAAAARSLYQQIVRQYPNDPAAAAANSQLR
jgi:TolA-binding protein